MLSVNQCRTRSGCRSRRRRSSSVHLLAGSASTSASRSCTHPGAAPAGSRGRHLRHGRYPASRASLLVAKNSTFSVRGLSAGHEGRQKMPVVATAVTKGIPVPAFSSALAYYDGYRNERLPANILQAQRDYFGAHTYERVDQPRGEFFHTNWTGRGGVTAATTYTA